ncbi:zf-HC2 domain-containing protein [Chitinophaga silvatica]|uniref:Zf-HC2 domain-containing protein n=1 Tax=Chitinophaga silvatica TaxID=2282649 RepID=A0A3E1YGD9_9BACT|nr:zf-HC2 domain-containing protein [Chitinophaga silvatica]RFS26432.1 zf-HC2 domain-containing protein [Chitinophaga silvatica]
MNEHFNDIFVTTGCPSQQQLLDYVQGKLSASEQHEVEMHLADCELCSEALDGLAAIKDKEKIPGWIIEMRWNLLKKLRQRYRPKRRLQTYISLAVLIFIILMILLGIFWTYYFVARR